MGLLNLTVALDVEQLRSAFSGLEAVVILYVGPDQMLPLASALGAMIGILLIVWHRMVGLSRKVWRLIRKKDVDSGSEAVRPVTLAEADEDLGRGNVDRAG
jgi:hypothetical protein